MVRRLADGYLLYNGNMWFVYALHNQEAGKIYIGQTSNLERRLYEHNLKRGNHYTAKTRGEWVIIYYEDCINKTKALIREKQLKSYQGRLFIKNIFDTKTLRSPVAQR